MTVATLTISLVLCFPAVVQSLADARQRRPPLDYTSKFRANALAPISISPIGYVSSPYKERFGTPRQPTVTENVAGGAAQEASIFITMDGLVPGALKDLEGFSHIWLISHLHLNKGWKSLVKPPRGPRDIKRGLLATRAPHRPTQIALSAVELIGVDVKEGRIDVRGIDLLDGTPILDVKPYVRYCDSIEGSSAGWIEALGLNEPGPDRLSYWPPPKHLLPDE